MAAVIVVPGGPSGHLAIVAAHGLGVPAEAGLTAALRNRITSRADPARSGRDVDVLPSQPGGPALRSHRQSTVPRAGTVQVLGVLALAHHARWMRDASIAGAVDRPGRAVLERSRPA